MRLEPLREEIRSLREKWSGDAAPRFYDALCDLLLKAGKIRAALNLMETPLAPETAFDPVLHGPGVQDEAWWFARGLEYADACLYEEACACLHRAVAAGSGSFEAHYCLAGIYKSLGRPDKAEFHCRESLRRNPAFPPSFVLLASIHRQEGRFVDSADAARMAVFLDPDFAPAHYDLACYYALAGEGKRALAALETAVARGFCDFDWIERDPDLRSVRGRPEFRLIVESRSVGNA